MVEKIQSVKVCKANDWIVSEISSLGNVFDDTPKVPFISRNLRTVYSIRPLEEPIRKPDKIVKINKEFEVLRMWYDNMWLSDKVKKATIKKWEKEGIMKFNRELFELPTAELRWPYYSVGGWDNLWDNETNTYNTHQLSALVNVYFTRLNENFKKYLYYIRERSQIWLEKEQTVVDINIAYLKKLKEMLNTKSIPKGLKFKLHEYKASRVVSVKIKELSSLVKKLLFGHVYINLKKGIFAGEDGINFFYTTKVPICPIEEALFTCEKIYDGRSKEKAKEISEKEKEISDEIFKEQKVKIERMIMQELRDTNLPRYKWIDLASGIQIYFQGLKELEENYLVFTDNSVEEYKKKIKEVQHRKDTTE